MRDEDRLREKREFSLDDKRAWALGFSALLLLGGVFVVGVMVGRRMAPDSRPPATGYRLPQTALIPSAPPGVAALPASPPVEEKSALAPTPAEKPPPAEKPAQGRAPTIVPPPKPATVVPPPPPPVQIAAAPPALTPPPKDLGDYTVQIGASQDRNEAQRMQNKARAAGLKPYVVEAHLGGKGTWYRVRVGAFKDKAAATRFRADVERELRAPAVVMNTH